MIKHTEHTRQTIELIINDSKRVVERRIHLSDQDLSSLDLSGLDLSGANLRGADLQRAKLQEANLRGANLRDADLRGAYLQRANLQEAYLRGADLQRANLQEAYLQDANLDFTGYELSCRTIGIIADSRLVSQLLYHICSMNVQDCPEWDELRNDERVIALANQSHVISKHALATIEGTNSKTNNNKTKTRNPSRHRRCRIMKCKYCGMYLENVDEESTNGMAHTIKCQTKRIHELENEKAAQHRRKRNDVRKPINNGYMQ